MMCAQKQRRADRTRRHDVLVRAKHGELQVLKGTTFFSIELRRAATRPSPSKRSRGRCMRQAEIATRCRKIDPKDAARQDAPRVHQTHPAAETCSRQTERRCDQRPLRSFWKAARERRIR